MAKKNKLQTYKAIASITITCIAPIRADSLDAAIKVANHLQWNYFITPKDMITDSTLRITGVFEDK